MRNFVEQLPRVVTGRQRPILDWRDLLLPEDYERAILEYDTVIKKYPSGDKVPAAMLKEGFAFLELNDTAHAKTIFSEIVKKYPKEPQAETASKRLETSIACFGGSLPAERNRVLTVGYRVTR